jgi:alpha-beta hydrolase superfamily lysophospholipase
VTLDFSDETSGDQELLATTTGKHRVLEEWTITGSSGDRVRVDISVGEAVDRVVVVAHGADNSRRARYIEVMAKSFPRHGSAIVAMDAPLHGDRDGAREMTDPVGAQVDLMIQSVKDHRRLIDVVADRWPTTPIGFAGFSMGGLHGVPLMAIEDRIRSGAIVIAGSTQVSYPQRFKRLSKQVRERIAVTDPAVHAPRVGDRPVMVLNAAEDEIVSRESAIALYDAFVGPKELVFMPGTHTEWGYAARWFRRLEQFFVETLRT